MTEAQIKEKISEHFVGLIAANAGVNVNIPLKDYGVDFIYQKIESYRLGKSLRYMDTGKALGVQIKCTTQNQIREEKGRIVYDLTSKNFNDLIWRKEEFKKEGRIHIPLILILVILNPKTSSWLEYMPKENRLVLSGKAYWYFPFEDEKFTNNKRTYRIKIPIENLVELDFFENTFNLFY